MCDLAVLCVPCAAENGALVLTLGGVKKNKAILPGKGNVMMGCAARDGSPSFFFSYLELIDTRSL